MRCFAWRLADTAGSLATLNRSRSNIPAVLVTAVTSMQHARRQPAEQRNAAVSSDLSVKSSALTGKTGATLSNVSESTLTKRPSLSTQLSFIVRN
ncbi:hypothetical protein BaRGS_00005971 [Batillaria attramentaria]|uniref:Uncharacterized protein n=1 Tax=Batillaria attramentaria TaxID=370345 RepID=A0ABD0LT95_9CAEN